MSSDSRRFSFSLLLNSLCSETDVFVSNNAIASLSVASFFYAKKKYGWMINVDKTFHMTHIRALQISLALKIASPDRDISFYVTCWCIHFFLSGMCPHYAFNPVSVGFTHWTQSKIADYIISQCVYMLNISFIHKHSLRKWDP